MHYNKQKCSRKAGETGYCFQHGPGTRYYRGPISPTKETPKP